MFVVWLICVSALMRNEAERNSTLAAPAFEERLFDNLAAVAGNFMTKCSWWSHGSPGDQQRWIHFGDLCGVGSKSPGDLAEYVEEVAESGRQAERSCVR